jgi:TolA-binding protein
MNWPEVAIAGGSFLLSVLAWYAATRANNQTNRLEQLKVSADAYDKAQIIYDRAIAQLSRQNEQLENQLSRCESRIDQLEQALVEAGIQIPRELHRVRSDRDQRMTADE